VILPLFLLGLVKSPRFAKLLSPRKFTIRLQYCTVLYSICLASVSNVKNVHLKLELGVDTQACMPLQYEYVGRLVIQ
jgi:hypothetical protein